MGRESNLWRSRRSQSRRARRGCSIPAGRRPTAVVVECHGHLCPVPRSRCVVIGPLSEPGGGRQGKADPALRSASGAFDTLGPKQEPYPVGRKGRTPERPPLRKQKSKQKKSGYKLKQRTSTSRSYTRRPVIIVNRLIWRSLTWSALSVSVRPASYFPAQN